MANVRVVPRSLTEAYKRREGDFAPNLVGFQFTNGVSLFTFGNFEITTNLDPRLNVNFTLGGQWSDYYSLDNLNISASESTILQSNELFIRLNFNPFNISRYVYFGSFYEFTRVTVQDVIQKWKGSLYLNPTAQSNVPANTVLSFSYNSGNDTAQFLIPKSVLQNKFQLIIDDNQDFDIPAGEIYNLTRDYNKYVIWNIQTNTETPIIGYTGSTDNFQYLTVQTKGNPFPTLTASTFGQLTYHVKPNAVEVQLFFEQLLDFEKVLLNRLTTPIYKATFDVPRESETGIYYVTTENFIWPVSDGYNLDIDTRDYGSYIESLLNAVNNFDQYKTDLISRRFVSESIHEFDTNGGTATRAGDELYGMKVSKLLRIYGREYDEVKKYIDGISFANVVTYNKLDNTSDELIKIIAKNLGFDVLLTVTTDNFNLLEQITPSFQTPFSGYSRSLSARELDIELWRRLVINSWWLFKSKGTRKVIEFFFNLFNIPQCMLTLNEYVYLAENRLNPIEVYQKLDTIYGGPNLFNVSDIPMDDFGFPRILPETQENYFQMDGFWYNGGNTSSIGNNPHIGPYDFGLSYFNQFECFVPNFNDFLTGSTLVNVTKNYFNNYNKGAFIFDQNGLPVPYYGPGYANTLNNNNLVENVVVNSAGLTYVGGNNAPNYARPSGDTYSMKISFTAGNRSVCDPCAQYELIFGADGIVYIRRNRVVQGEDPNIPFTNALCCKTYWLPTTVNPPTCPNSSELQIDINNNVLFNGVTVSQECCTTAILGFNVSWDGRKCIVPGRDSGTGTGIGVELGPIETVDLGSGLGSASRTAQYSANDIFAIGSDPPPPVDTNNYVCYWCPPLSYTQTICSPDDYLAILTNTQIIQTAIDLGAPPNVDITNATNFISSLYQQFFTTYGCLILDNQDNIIKDRACCELRGGVLTNINGVNYCIKPNPNPCVGSQVSSNTHVWVTPNNTLLPQSCCNQNGQYWVSPVSLDGNNVTLVTQNGITTFLDIPGSTFAQSSSYCSACPNNLMEMDTVIVDSNNNDLTQHCCLDYGFTWNSNTNKCLNCPSVVNYGVPTNEYLITTVNGEDLSAICCQTVGGWFGNAFGEGDKCYTCPGVMIYDSSGNATPNPDYKIIGVAYPVEITYQGNSLSQQCCTLYNTQFGGAQWDAEQQKCLIYSN